MKRRPIPALAEGSVIGGRYQLEKQLGAGGFGRVFQAVQMPLGRRVAIKLLVSQAPGTSARFAREAALAQRLEHPNTVRVLDFGATPEGAPFIVFELIRGMSVADLLARHGPMPLPVALEIADQVLKSLMEAHALGIVHRDIKPANVMVTSHPGEPYFVKVLDFGIAKDLTAPAARPKAGTVPLPAAPGGSPALTSANEMVGTPRYMAPEQARGEDTGPETDVYAVGLLLAEMLLGRPVYAEENAMLVAMAQASSSPVPLGPLAASPVAGLLARATQKERAARYPSASAMLAAVEQAQGKSERPAGTVRIADDRIESGITAEPTQVTPSADPRAGAIVVRRRTLWLGAASVIALAALATLGITLLGASEEKGRGRVADKKEADEEEEEGKRRAPQRKPKALEDPPTIDWAKRSVPASADILATRLERSGYELKPPETAEAPGYAQWTWRVFDDSCGGVVIFQTWGDQTVAEEAEKAQRKTGIGISLRTETRTLFIILASHETGARDDPRCTVPLADLLTR
ncbi:MAG: serine/threonine protein kinase [Myxococcales bacterium]|nr:serine/threonine protein kinase [Myxococcales bacterium]